MIYNFNHTSIDFPGSVFSVCDTFTRSNNHSVTRENRGSDAQWKLKLGINLYIVAFDKPQLLMSHAQPYFIVTSVSLKHF